MHLGIDVTAGINGPNAYEDIWFPTISKLCTVMAGAKPVSLLVGIQSEATNIRSYCFFLPDKHHLIVLWVDGAAVDNDSRVKAALTLDSLSSQGLPSFPPERVTGINILDDFEQEMMTSYENGNLIIHDLLARDYPIVHYLDFSAYGFLPIVWNGGEHW